MKKYHPLLLAFWAASIVTAAPERPNIIHIMVDDLGWRDLSAYGSETYETPHLDRLVERGMLFTESYSASPLCSPTRAATLTGQTVGRLRITIPQGHFDHVVLDPSEGTSAAPGLPMTQPGNRTRLPLETFTLGNLFQNAGYKTAFLGKWHLGHYPFIPENFGFEYVVGGRATHGPPENRFFGPWDPETSNMPPVEGNPNVDDVLGDLAVDFITKHQNEPFFIAMWFYNVHAPFEGKPEVIEQFRTRANDADFQQSAIMASMVKTLDDNVGKLMDALDDLGLADNTLLIFTSDNGGNMYDRPEGVYPTNNHPLRAGKGNSYEGGVRVPLIVSWPGVVPAGVVSNAINISYDWFPTFTEIIGGDVPPDHPVDGESLLPALRGKPFERGPIFSIFGHNISATGNIANAWVREGNWKLLRFFHMGEDFADELELYDLSVDSGETRNLASRYPELAQRLNKVLGAHLEDSATLLPRVNPNFDPNFRHLGFELLQGGLRLDDHDAERSTIVGKDSRVVLSYFPEEPEAGNILRLEVASNCATLVSAGVGKPPLYGQAQAILPNAQRQVIHLPLGQNAEAGDAITVAFDLGHPGRLTIISLKVLN